ERSEAATPYCRYYRCAMVGKWRQANSAKGLLPNLAIIIGAAERRVCTILNTLGFRFHVRGLCASPHRHRRRQHGMMSSRSHGPTSLYLARLKENMRKCVHVQKCSEFLRSLSYCKFERASHSLVG